MANNSRELAFEEILSHLNKIVMCRKSNGKEFMGKLVDIEGDFLIFENKKGNRLENPITSIVYMAEL